jgi:AGCS family alanine or glycine:cation symporter
MWLSGILGMATKYSEIVLAVRFRERNLKGEWVGGPMYYIKNGLGGAWNILAAIFAAIGAAASSAAGTSFRPTPSPFPSKRRWFHFSRALPLESLTGLAVGLVVAGFAGAVIFGGLKRIRARDLVSCPFMGIFYIFSASAVVLSNLERPPPCR